MPPPYDTEGHRRGGLIEGLSRRRAPVGEQWLLIVIGQAHAADVARGAVVQVQPPEAQARLGCRQRLESIRVEAHERLLLGHRRRRARRLLALRAPEILTRTTDQLIESGVEGGDTCTLGGELSLAPGRCGGGDAALLGSVGRHGALPNQGEDRSCRIPRPTARPGQLAAGASARLLSSQVAQSTFQRAPGPSHGSIGSPVSVVMTGSPSSARSKNQMPFS